MLEALLSCMPHIGTTWMPLAGPPKEEAVEGEEGEAMPEEGEEAAEGALGRYGR